MISNFEMFIAVSIDVIVGFRFGLAHFDVVVFIGIGKFFDF